MSFSRSVISVAAYSKLFSSSTLRRRSCRCRLGATRLARYRQARSTILEWSVASLVCVLVLGALSVASLGALLSVAGVVLPLFRCGLGGLSGGGVPPAPPVPAPLPPPAASASATARSSRSHGCGIRRCHAAAPAANSSSVSRHASSAASTCWVVQPASERSTTICFGRCLCFDGSHDDVIPIGGCDACEHGETCTQHLPFALAAHHLHLVPGLVANSNQPNASCSPSDACFVLVGGAASLGPAFSVASSASTTSHSLSGSAAPSHAVAAVLAPSTRSHSLCGWNGLSRAYLSAGMSAEW
mmetsp:Transcript_12215/g.32437  ORF Transcript_12215/g.32437 Transcript_12215/m.32437 type:complete len:300 (+) Transcript_12215:125-1024(+)